MKIADIPEIYQLSVSEKLQLVEALWDDVRDNSVRDNSRLPLPDWHRQALDESAAAYENNPKEGSPWGDVKNRLLSRVK